MEAPKIKKIYNFSSKLVSKTFKQILQREFSQSITKYEIYYINDTITEDNLQLVKGADAIICFVRDKLNDKVLSELAKQGVKAIFLRCQNHYWVDTDAAKKHNIPIAYAPHYSPYSVAEFAMTLLSCVNRKIHKAYNRTREGNFELDGLMGVDLHGKTAGVMGLGKIGRAFAKICIGYGMKVLAWDKVAKNEENLKVQMVTLDELLAQSDVISLHLGLNEETKYIINQKTIAKMKKDAFLINTARGALINGEDLLAAVLEGRFSGVGLDVYDDKYEVFYKDFGQDTMQDHTLAQLLTISRVLITCRQGWLTKEGICDVLGTILKNAESFNQTGKLIDSIY